MTDEDLERRASEAMKNHEYAEAKRLLDPLLDRDSIYALTTIGSIYENGYMGVEDKVVARGYYQKAIDAGDVYSYYRLGWMLLNEGELEHARIMFRSGKENGDADCSNALDILELNESERLAFEAMKVRDFIKARDLLLPLAKYDSEYTLMMLGWLYESGLAGVADKSLAISYYERAASIGCIAAHYRVGLLKLEQGKEEEARIDFSHGVELNHLASVMKLGEMMIDGRGGAIDLDYGLLLIKSAADQGHIMARRKLLTLEGASTSSILKKVVIKIKIAMLAKDAVKEFLEDEFSPKVEEIR